MKEYPILFNTEMVKAILDGRKAQTRRPIKGQDIVRQGISHPEWANGEGHAGNCWYCHEAEYPEEGSLDFKCPFGQIGDRLWVRETFRPFQPHQEEGVVRGYQYKADNSFNYIPPLAEDEGCLINKIDDGKWKPSIHMPRAACRIILEITDIKIERVQDITNEDAQAEGIRFLKKCKYSQQDWWGIEPDNYDIMMPNPKSSFVLLWNSIYKNWGDNPWVWIVEFKRI